MPKVVRCLQKLEKV